MKGIRVATKTENYNEMSIIQVQNGWIVNHVDGDEEVVNVFSEWGLVLQHLAALREKHLI